MAVEYMFRKGYRRLATIIRSLDHDVYREKIAGVKRGMEDKGLAIDEYSFMVLAEAQKKLKAMSKARNDIDCFIYLAGGASTFRRMEAELFPKSLKGKPFITVSTSSKGKAPILLEQIEATGKKAGEMLLKLFDNTAQQPFTIKFPPILISK